MPTPTPAPAPIRRLLRLAPPSWGLLALAIFGLLVSNAAGLALPLGVRVILDDATLDWTRNKLALALGVLAVFGGATFLRYSLFHIASEQVVMKIKNRLYRNLLRQEIGFFDRVKTGQLISCLSVDTVVLQDALSSNLAMGLQSLLGVVGSAVMLFVLSARLSVVVLAMVPVLGLGALIFGRLIQKTSRAVQDSLADANQIADEALAGIRTVRTLAAEEEEAGRYEKSTQLTFDRARRRAVVVAVWGGLTSVVGYGALLGVLGYGGMLVSTGQITVGALGSFILYGLFLSSSLADLSDRWAALKKASGSAARVIELLERSAGAAERGTRQLGVVNGGIEFKDVHFSYPTRLGAQVLTGLNLSVAAGEVVALVGASGAGKSTVAALLARLYEPTRGAVYLDGCDLAELDPHWLRQRISSVSQEPILFSGTLTDNIRYGQEDVNFDRVEAAARAANAHEFIQLFPDGYNTRVGERGLQLSGGQKQRVAIARALLRAPRVLILDEATSALDSENEFLVQEALGRLMQGRTTLLIAHRLSTVKGANRVFVLEEGRVVQSGNHASLMREGGLYRRLVERQFMSEEHQAPLLEVAKP